MAPVAGIAQPSRRAISKINPYMTIRLCSATRFTQRESPNKTKLFKAWDKTKRNFNLYLANKSGENMPLTNRPKVFKKGNMAKISADSETPYRMDMSPTIYKISPKLAKDWPNHK